MRLKSLALVAMISVLAVAGSNCICIDYFHPPMQWYNYSYDPAPNVTIGLNIYTLGPQPITILDSDSGQINFSIYTYYSGPMLNDRHNDSQLNINFLLPGTDMVTPGITVDTLVYLPHGPNYTLAIYNLGSPVITKYTGGNLTLWANDPDHSPHSFYPDVTYYPNGTGDASV